METENLYLREWRDEDLPAFIDLNGDARVMKYFPAALTREHSVEFLAEIRRRFEIRGWGFWAIEHKSDGGFVGFAGLNVPGVSLPFTPCVEIGWRLNYKYWGRGLATEAADKCLHYAFQTLNLDEIVAFTSLMNHRSESLMRRLGMKNTGLNFHHPSVLKENPLSEHVLYKMTRRDWQASMRE